MPAASADPIDHLLRILWDAGATDLILTVDSPPLLRIDGGLRLAYARLTGRHSPGPTPSD